MTRSIPQPEPDLTLAGLAIWVHGYQFSTAKYDSDANWLIVTARCEADGATVKVSGPIISTTDFQQLAEDCDRLHGMLQGEATCDPLEPHLHITLRYTNRSGQLEARVSITPDQVTQRHDFTFALDQSFLPAVSSNCREILRRFPLRFVEGVRGA